MNYDAWSGEDRALPRVEELPVAEQGYERDAVRQAFDAFYRHIARLDSTLKTLEAVEIFQRQAGELRTELRALRSAGWTQQPWSTYTAMPADRHVRTLVPPALPRIASEVVFIIAVAVIAGVGHFSATLIVVLMVAAWAVVAAVEWFAARERIPPRVAAPAPPVIEGTLEPAPQPSPAETEPEPEPEPQPQAEYGWSAFSEAAEQAGADAMTIAGGMPQDDESVPEEAAAEEPEPVVEEPEPVVEEPEPVIEEPEPTAEEPVAKEPEPVAEEAEPAAAEPVAADPDGAQPRRRWFRRHRHEPDERESEPAPAPVVPSNVRVLSAEEREDRRKENEAAAAESELEPDESTDENIVGPLRRFRRR